LRGKSGPSPIGRNLHGYAAPPIIDAA
jgi:hypothetical protein